MLCLNKMTVVIIKVMSKHSLLINFNPDILPCSYFTSICLAKEWPAERLTPADTDSWKSARGPSFDFSQTLCCRGHVCVQNARTITRRSVGFSGRRQVLLSLVGRSDRVTSCAAAWQFLPEDEFKARPQQCGCTTDALLVSSYRVSPFFSFI